uniref:Uncharacterized protein n=1 Tax=Anguilla anguilla TaxID=7936 RepID=A0A0E9SIF4_ANGAN
MSFSSCKNNRKILDFWNRAFLEHLTLSILSLLHFKDIICYNENSANRPFGYVVNFFPLFVKFYITHTSSNL